MSTVEAVEPISDPLAGHNLGRKTVVYLPMAFLNPNQYNPAPRMENQGHLNPLIKSIREDGLQYPILVSKRTETEYEIIDGHRRFAAYKNEHREEMPCIVADGNSAHLFGVVNALSRPLKGTDWALVFVNGGQLPKGVTANNLQALSRLVGNDAIKAMAEQGLSPGVYQTARRIVRYAYKIELARTLSDDTAETQDLLTKVVRWLVRYRESANSLAIINRAGPAEAIREAVEEGRKIKTV